MGEPYGVISEDRIRDAITLAKNMRNNGASLAAIESRLSESRLRCTGDQGRDGSHPAGGARQHHPQAGHDDGWPRVLVVVGLIISALGLLLSIGDQSGLAPAVPLFGIALTVIGGVIMAAGRS